MAFNKVFAKFKLSTRFNPSVQVRFFPYTDGEYDDRYVRLFGSIAAWLPFLFVFSHLPSQLYFSNALNFEYRYSILYPYFGLTLLSLFLLVWVGQFSAFAVQKVLDGLFFLGVFSVLSFGIVPIQWGELNGHDELRESLEWGVVQGLIFFVLFLCWLHLPSALIRRPGAVFVSVMFASQLFIMTQIFNRPSENNAALKTDVVAGSDMASRPNIYHVVFDAYSGRSFRDMSKLVMSESELNGFTFFPKAMAHYPFTDLSVPSFLTGETYREGSLKAFQSEAKTGGLSEALRQVGYKTSSYSPNRVRFWSHSNATQIYATSDDYSGQIGKTFMLVSAVRAAPEFLRQETHAVLSKYLWNAENSYSYYKRLSVPLVAKFLEDEENRADQGHYNYVHLILPHGPYVRKGDCSIEGETSYLDQAECATRLMKRIVAKLKEMNRYYGSIIVFHSDHGSLWEPEKGNPIEPFPSDTRAEYDRLGHFIAPEQFLGILDALLLVKTVSNEKQALTESDLLVQLVDIPATVLGLVGLANSFGDGRAIFSNYTERDVPVFIPSRNVSTIRQRSLFESEDEKAGVFGHFSLSPTEGWKAHDDIDIFHEGWMRGVF